ncbi:MAG: CxxxxCH/CxxCH domain-containing protein [Candidatus Lernaella stagnicola]|nr:CxxxxCH/CxxCH domain-containing protein [Candidatus Lernaella stagnicola]
MKHDFTFTSRAGVCLVACLLAALFAWVVACDNGSGSSGDGGTPADDDDGGLTGSVAMQDVDDCGFPVVPIPEGCSDCHKAPPQTARHPQNRRCYRCHGNVVGQDMKFVQVALHNNGEVNVAVGCSSCHGWDKGVSPPQNLNGNCSDDRKGVGSHQAMRRDAIPAHRTNCINCHDVPLGVWAAGHIDGDNKAEIHFQKLATIGGATPTWDGTTCSNVYCHGATLEGGTAKEPVWGDNSGKYGACGACHRLTDPQGNAAADCYACHADSVNPDRTIKRRGTHINGTIDMVTPTKGGSQ